MIKLFSISTHPGKTGEHFYNSLFANLGLTDYVYKSMRCSNLARGVSSLLKVRDVKGFSVSMPYKSGIVKYLDYADPIVKEFGCCNTVLKRDGEVHGFNTDYFGAAWTLSHLRPGQRVSILGNGSMGNMYKKMMGSRHYVMYSPSLGNWQDRHKDVDVIINCTPYGTSIPGSPLEYLPETDIVIDLSMKLQNQLEDQCFEHGVKYVRGVDFYKRHFVRQFQIYTGMEITIADMDMITTL